MPHFAPILDALADRVHGWIGDGARRIGISGPQGSGKSTLAYELAAALSARGRRSAVTSLDDFYLGRAERAELARGVHPLLATRGVPGTHDLDLCRTTHAALLDPAGGPVRLPRFVKTADDRAPAAQWPVVEAPVEALLFEGWCVGIGPADAEEPPGPINGLERDEDPDGCWRGFIEDRLHRDYAEFNTGLDRLVYLQIPDFDCVAAWRGQQERDNARRDGGRGMNESALARFIAHYERLTRRGLRTLPARADAVVRLDRDHRPTELLTR